MKYWGKHTLLSIFNREFISKNRGYMDSVLRTDICALVEMISSTVTNVPSPSGTPMLTRGFGLNLIGGIAPRDSERILRAYEKALSKFFTRLYSDVVDASYRMTECNGSLSYELFFEKRIAGVIREIPCRLESAGTKLLIALFPSFIGCAEGQTAFIDEMDSGVHDKLIFDLMQQILPDLKGQLVVTTHNTSLLEFLPPANAFVLNVDSEGFKAIYPFSDVVRTQKNNNNRNRYLQGQFDGVPIIGYIGLSEIASAFHDEVMEL